MATVSDSQAYLENLCLDVTETVKNFSDWLQTKQSDKEVFFKITPERDSAVYVQIKIVIVARVAPGRKLLKTKLFVFNQEDRHQLAQYLKSLKCFCCQWLLPSTY